ncbi:GNAT family acetyltransferase [Streptococcus pneumoniae]|nr:GNAT family acetyltransferase [Streptococcus pneumoniae]VOY08436.1 GNAT family acetyltransferase [Streptococcus pneumoniae]VPO81898.1 GNAT family acetyltransferase [Streptococcus pneumoniae]VTH71972.1 GNAT family acetyltransferase [Streptococcus pneumoniae]
MFVIEEVKDENQKKAVVAEVLKDLTEWFGIPEKHISLYKRNHDTASLDRLSGE